VRGAEIYGPRRKEGRGRAESRRERESRERRKRNEGGKEGRAGSTRKERPRRVAREGTRGGGLRRAEDDDIDCVLDPVVFAVASAILPGATQLPPSSEAGWDKMAAGRTSRGGRGGEGGRGGSARVPGLCVVINGNLKQRELTISFFISSPMLRGERTPTNAARARARVCVCARSGGMPFAPTTRVDLLLEGGKRASERGKERRAAP